ncbi:Metaxin [Sergentomyia squamirostris]
MSEITLHVYQGEWGLPSIDLECLTSLALLKFAEIPVNINTRGSTFFSPSGTLPYLNDGTTKISSYKDILEYVKKKGGSLNRGLRESDLNPSQAYLEHLRTKLHSYLTYTLWGRAESAEATRFLYAKRTPFPMSFFKPGQILNKADQYLQIQRGFSIKSGIPPEEHLTRQITIDAKIFINEISKQLGDQEWFFGSSPSEFDANLYSYLALLLHYPQNFNPLAGHIRECKNLVKYVNRITTKYFEGFTFDSGKAQETAKSGRKTKSKSTTGSQDEEESNWKIQVFFGLFSIVSMVAFSLSTGILEISRESISPEGMDFDDEDDEETEDN